MTMNPHQPEQSHQELWQKLKSVMDEYQGQIGTQEMIAMFSQALGYYVCAAQLDGNPMERIQKVIEFNIKEGVLNTQIANQQTMQ